MSSFDRIGVVSQLVAMVRSSFRGCLSVPVSLDVGVSDEETGYLVFYAQISGVFLRLATFVIFMSNRVDSFSRANPALQVGN